MNLAVNARDAMPTGGRLTVETSNVVRDEAYVRHHAGARQAPTWCAVTDTGTGMSAEAGALPRGHETILLVEHEPDLRDLALEILAMHGYVVLVAAEADEALRLADGHAGRPDLLLTDVMMPGMSGRELAVELAARRPGLRVLYMSGYTADAMAGHGVLEPEIMFLQKPYSPAALAHKVREALDVPIGNRAG